MRPVIPREQSLARFRETQPRGAVCEFGAIAVRRQVESYAEHRFVCEARRRNFFHLAEAKLSDHGPALNDGVASGGEGMMWCNGVVAHPWRFIWGQSVQAPVDLLRSASVIGFST
jgi:hypothetical protein